MPQPCLFLGFMDMIFPPPKTVFIHTCKHAHTHTQIACTCVLTYTHTNASFPYSSFRCPRSQGLWETFPEPCPQPPFPEGGASALQPHTGDFFHITLFILAFHCFHIATELLQGSDRLIVLWMRARHKTGVQYILVGSVNALPACFLLVCAPRLWK